MPCARGHRGHGPNNVTIAVKAIDCAGSTSAAAGIGSANAGRETPEPGMPVFSVDGNKVGSVESVDRTADGKVTAVNVVTGSFLGFGSKLVSIPDGRFAYDGKIVRIEMTADDVSALPHQGP